MSISVICFSICNMLCFKEMVCFTSV